jgi:purine-binding chemotaxis protein CheW
LYHRRSAATPSGESTLIGTIVDAVEEVVHLTAADIEAASDFGGVPDTQCILGLATIQGGVKTLLNIEKIVLDNSSFSLISTQKPEV